MATFDFAPTPWWRRALDRLQTKGSGGEGERATGVSYFGVPNSGVRHVDSKFSQADVAVFPWFQSAALWRNVAAIASLVALDVVNTAPLPEEGCAPSECKVPPGGVPPQCLVLTDQEELPEELENQPRIRVAFAGDESLGADVILPGDEKELLIALDAYRGTAFPGALYLVGFWAPVGDPCEVSREVADFLDAALVDASGQRLAWQPPEGAVTWENLIQEGRSLTAASVRAALPTWRGTQILTSNGEKPMRASNPLAGRVAAGLSGDVVIDCGFDLDALIEIGSGLQETGIKAGVALVGDTGKGSINILARCLAAFGNSPVLEGCCVLVKGKPGPHLWSTLTRLDAKVFRLPQGSKRGWRKIARCLWSSPNSLEGRG